MEVVNWVPGITLEYVERMAIESAIKFYRGNKTQTSIALGISVRTLDTKLEKYEADRQLYEIRLKEENEKRRADEARMRGGAPYRPAEDAQTSFPGSRIGLHLKPAAQAPAELAVPLSERAKVQEMLSRQAAPSGQRKGRQDIRNSDGETAPGVPDGGQSRKS